MGQSAEEIMSEFARPFARALAVFVDELTRRQDGPITSSREVYPADVEELDQQELEAEFAQVDKMASEGTLETLELTERTLPELITFRIRAALEAKGWSQARLAEEIGVSATVISRVLKQPDRSRVATLHRIASVLGIDLSRLFLLGSAPQ